MDTPQPAAHKTLSERADELEEQQMQELENIIIQRSLLYDLGNGHQPTYKRGGLGPGKTLMMGEDPRLPEMPDEPTLMDFVKLRFSIGGQQHLLQSAKRARDTGQPEKVIFACLLHDIAVSGFIRADHGYWGAQLIAPYVDEEVAWAIKVHQALRFFPDESVGYEYPEMYIRMFGENYQPEPYIVAEYEAAKNHKWYMSARLICMNDLYAFDPDVEVTWDEFEDVLGRNFKQPKDGLGNDNSASAHMWRTLRRPCNAL